MAQLLFATMPITGHVRPVLPIAKLLSEQGHDVVWYCGHKFESIISRNGARFSGITSRLDFGDSWGDVLQDMVDRKPGIAGFKKIIRELFIDAIPGYAADIAPLIAELEPDAVVADHSFLAAPMMARRAGVRNVMLAISPLHVSSVDTAPFGTGLRPSSSPLGRLRNKALQWVMDDVVFRDVQRALLRVTAEVGAEPMRGNFMNWGWQMADRYLATTIPEFEYPRSDLPAAVEFVGPVLPEGVDDWTPPPWWPDIEAARAAGRPVVLVTQGTATSDPALLVVPALTALAGEDALVIATTDQADPDTVLPPAKRPRNLRLERFVPFTELLPMTDLVITNGGYGGVQMSLAYGVPLVAAGMSEDKMEVNTRVTWSGAGVSLKTGEPTPAELLAAAREVLDGPAYRARAKALRSAYARYRGARQAAEMILETATEATRAA